MTQHYKTLSDLDPIVTTEEAKAYLKVETADDDELITALVATATDECESFTSKLVAIRTVEITCDCPQRIIGFQKGPITEITEVVVHTDTGSSVVAEADYRFDVASQQIVFLNTAILDGLREVSPVVITAEAGYEADEVPAVFKTAVKARLAQIYDSREAVTEFSAAIKILLQPYKRIWV